MTEHRNISLAQKILAVPSFSRSAAFPGRSNVPTSRIQRIFLIATVLAIFLTSGFPATADNAITTIHEWKNLTPDQTAKGRTLHLSGVVMCYDSGWNQLYIYDGHETGYFNPHNFTTQPQS